MATKKSGIMSLETNEKKIKDWITNILVETYQLKNNKGSEILESCGKNCAKDDYLHIGATEIRSKFPNATDDELFDAYKKEHYNTDRLLKEGNNITLIFEECSCPIVKMGVNDPNMCNCTVGYSKMIFETLFGKEIKVELKESILNGDKSCRQIIHI